GAGEGPPMRGHPALRGPYPRDVRGVRVNGQTGRAGSQVRREASLDAVHATGGHRGTRPLDPGEGRTRRGSLERWTPVPPRDGLHRRPVTAWGRPRTRDGGEEDEGVARERNSHHGAGVVHPPRLA